MERRGRERGKWDEVKKKERRGGGKRREKRGEIKDEERKQEIRRRERTKTRGNTKRR